MWGLQRSRCCRCSASAHTPNQAHQLTRAMDEVSRSIHQKSELASHRSDGTRDGRWSDGEVIAAAAMDGNASQREKVGGKLRRVFTGSKPRLDCLFPPLHRSLLSLCTPGSASSRLCPLFHHICPSPLTSYTFRSLDSKTGDHLRSLLLICVVVDRLTLVFCCSPPLTFLSGSFLSFC